MLNINPKKLAFPAAFGFALFFLVSLIFTHKILPALLRGVIFGLLFALIFFGIDFVFTRFLNDGEEITSSPSQGGRRTVASSPGGSIYITISDEELTDDGQGLRFPVSRNKHALIKEESSPIPDSGTAQKLKQDAYSLAGKSEPSFRSLDAAPASGAPQPVVSSSSASSAKEESKVQASSGANSSEGGTFTPVSLGKPFPSGGSAGSSISEQVHSNEKSDLDELPEILDFAPKAGNAGANDNVIVDSDFARDGVKPSASEKPMFADGSRATDHNTETLARAIQTVLKRDE